MLWYGMRVRVHRSSKHPFISIKPFFAPCMPILCEYKATVDRSFSSSNTFFERTFDIHISISSTYPKWYATPRFKTSEDKWRQVTAESYVKPWICTKSFQLEWRCYLNRTYIIFFLLLFVLPSHAYHLFNFLATVVWLVNSIANEFLLCSFDGDDVCFGWLYIFSSSLS